MSPADPVAEQLPQRLLVVRDAVPLHHRDEIPRRVSRQRRFGEVRIRRHEILRRGVPVGEIAASAARDQDLAPNLRVVLQHHHPPPAPPRLDGAHQPGGARSDYHRIDSLSRHPLTFWQSPALCCLPMTRKVLIVTGDGGDSYEALYACQRFLEAHWEPVIAAPSRRRLHMIFHDREPGWDTYVERAGHSLEAQMAITAVSTKEFAAIVILGGRAPEYLRNDASMLSLVREFAAQNKCRLRPRARHSDIGGGGPRQRAHRHRPPPRPGGSGTRRRYLRRDAGGSRRPHDHRSILGGAPRVLPRSLCMPRISEMILTPPL